VELQFSLAPDLRESKIDPQQLGQVLLNLAVNARDAMPEGGRLVIETANVRLDRAYCREHRETQAGDYVMLAVSDTGCGIDKDTQAHIFEPFFTTKEVGKGTGLGLSTAFGIVKQSGGSISVYSEPGKGSTFKVYLPVAEASVASVTESARRQDESRRGSERILVVEDEAPVRGLVVRILSRAGYQVRAAGSAQEAQRVLDSVDYQPDLLLTDVVLPGGANGRNVAETLLKRFPQLRVLFMSGYTGNAVVSDGHLDEGVAFLEKPFTPEKLLRKVQEVLDAEATAARLLFDSDGAASGGRPAVLG
jgi:CheY-like chemotaxis protein